MLENTQVCPICNTTTNVEDLSDRDSYNVNCPCCGKYIITDGALTMFQRSQLVTKILSVSYWIRQHQSPKSKPSITIDRMRKILIPFISPKPKEQADILLLWIGSNVEKPDAETSVPLSSLLSVIGAVDEKGIQYVAYYLKDKGYIKHSGFSYSVQDGRRNPPVDLLRAQMTFKGWEKYELMKSSTGGKQTVSSRSIELKDHKFFTEEINIEIEDLIKRGESDRIEYKGSFCFNVNKYLMGNGTEEIDGTIALKGVMKTIVAFLNTNGGKIIVGIIEKRHLSKIHDDKLLELVEFGDYYLLGIEKETVKAGRDGFELKIRDMIQEHIAKDLIGLIKINFAEYCGKELCILSISMRVNVWYYLDGKFYVRDGNRTIELTGNDADNYKSRIPL